MGPFIVKIVVPSGPPESFTNEERDMLDGLLEDDPAVKSNYLKDIELPLAHGFLGTQVDLWDSLTTSRFCAQIFSRRKIMTQNLMATNPFLAVVKLMAKIYFLEVVGIRFKQA